MAPERRRHERWHLRVRAAAASGGDGSIGSRCRRETERMILEITEHRVIIPQQQHVASVHADRAGSESERQQRLHPV
jgi:hypothetical protein